MEQARRIRQDDEFDVTSERGSAPALPPAPPVPEGIEKVLKFSIPARIEPEDRTDGPVTATEFAAAVDIVHAAAEAMRAAEERSRDAEARTHALAQRATEELKSAEQRYQSMEARARAAEARAQDAEKRADEAEGWLRQIFSTIADELPVRRPVKS